MKWKRTHGDDMNGAAISDKRYKITWAQNARGPWYNAWTPEPMARVLAAGYDKEAVKAACERHANVSRGEVA